MAPLYFLVYCVFTSALVSGQSTRYELVGLEVNLKPDISGQPDQILWKHNGNKVVEFDGKEEQVYGSYAGRVTLDWISAELHIRDLRYEDSGEYELEVFMNKNLLRSQFTVEVIDKVSKPTISCQMNDGSSSDTPELQATLMCSADSRRRQSLMKFEWISNGNVQPGPKLTIPLRDKQDDEVYSCRVSNPLSQETANFSAKDCYPDESSNVPLVASICALVILFIALVLGILFCKQQHKACFAKREESVKADEDKESLPARGTSAPTAPQLSWSDGKTDLSDKMTSPLNAATTCPSSQQHNQDKMPPEGLPRAPTCPSPQKLTQDERPLEGSDGRTDLSDEMSPFLKAAPTCPSSQQHNQDKMPPEDHAVNVKKLVELLEQTKDKNTDTNKETASPPVSPVRKAILQDGRTDLSDEMRPPVNRAPTCPSPQQPTVEELIGDRQPEDGRIDLSDETSPLLNGAPTCPSSQQHNQDKMPPEDHAVNVKKLVEFLEQTKDKNTDTNKETASPPVSPVRKTILQDGRTDLSDENRPLFHRAPTYPSPQQLTQDERPPEGKVKDRAQLYESLEDHVVSVKKVMELFEPTNAECTLPPDTSTESVKADEDKESLPARGTSAPTAPLLSPLTQNSPNMESDAAGKPKEDTDSDQVTGEPAEESDRESDSSDLEKINGPHDSSEEKQSSTVPEVKGSEITVHEQDLNLPQHETHTQEGEHQEMNKQVSGVRNESENDPEDVNKELTSSQLPQIPTEPENHNTDTAHTHPDKEEGDKTRHESDASEEQSDNSTAEANQGEGESEAAENDDQCDQNKEQETDNEREAVKTT